jgi:hypothetical protein
MLDQAKLKINLIMDTTYFGRDFGVMVFRGNPNIDFNSKSNTDSSSDSKTSEFKSSKFQNLYWKYLKSETVRDYYLNIYSISQLYKIESFTVDNKGGLIKMLERRYPYTPVQLCQFHMVASVIRLTTKHPKSQCGKDLLNLIFQLKNSTKKEFKQRLSNFLHTHINYLQQRNHTGKYIHEDLRQAITSITRNLKYLFTCESYPTQNIPKTTNSAEGSFGQWKYKVRLHRGIGKSRKIQMINELLQSTSKS